jgi:predicted transposase YbfD/YdcC
MARQEALAIGEHFAELPDPRHSKNRKHELLDILVIALCGVICGGKGCTEIAEFGQRKGAWLRRFLRLEHGIPSHDTFSRVLRTLDPEAFRRCFINWVQALHQATGGQVVAIDGKTLRGSFDTAAAQSPLHLVSAWSEANHLVLGQVAVDSKSNEITAIPKLLELLDISGAIVTIDAMGCQKDIAAQIIAQGGDYVLALKDNQPTLAQELADYFSEQVEDDFAEVSYRYRETREVGHGRQEQRHYYILDLPEGLASAAGWAGLRSFGVVISSRVIGDQEEDDVRYYLSSLRPNAKRFAGAVRGHWGIENRLHWVLDVTFDEDRCRVRRGHGAENHAILRHIALNLLKREPSKKSIKIKRLAAGWDNEFLLQVLTAGCD